MLLIVPSIKLVARFRRDIVPDQDGGLAKQRGADGTRIVTARPASLPVDQ
jgi:hypothetical protein